jgi:aldose 1-epimerase
VSDAGTLPDGRPVRRVVIGAPPGPVLTLLDLGARVQALEVECGDGVRRDVVLGPASPAGYLDATDYLGATVGRYANRIAHGRFPLGDVEVAVATNDRGNQLHGGPDGFDRRLWQVAEHSETSARFTLQSPDGDQGFPGSMHVEARFEVSGSEVRIGLVATTDAPTVVNLTNHAYFNLDGSGTVHDHELTVEADEFTPVDRTGIPLDGPAPVAGTPFDFHAATRIGPAVRSDDEQIRSAGGIDHNYVLRGSGLRRAAVLASRRTGTTLELRTDQPGLQVYTGNSLTPQGAGIALEPQLFPDTPNRPEFGSAVLRPGETYRSTLVWSFSAATPA